MKEPCRSGIRTIHIDPDRAREALPGLSRWTSTGRSSSEYKPIDCNACYYACRGEAQAPLQLSRVRDVMA